MARYPIPQNTGKVRVAVGHFFFFFLWNGKQGKHEFVIVCRDRKQANEIAEIINKKQHEGFVEVFA